MIIMKLPAQGAPGDETFTSSITIPTVDIVADTNFKNAGYSVSRKFRLLFNNCRTD